MAGRARAAGVGWWRPCWASFVAWVASLHLGRGRGDELDGALEGVVGGAAVRAQAQARWLAIAAVALPFAGVLVAGPAVGAVVVVMLLVSAWWASRGADARCSSAADAELPMLLEGVARRLRAGGSLTEAMAAQVGGGVVGSPLAEAWGRVVADVPTLGVVGALDAWVVRNPRPPVRLAAAALALAAETGGSPARAVDGVAATLRARASVAREVRALTSQARASAVVIASAPVAFALLAGATDARTRAAYRTSVGTALVIAGLMLDVVGGWWMARLCRVRVAT